MFTVHYKGFYIQCYCDKPECYVNYELFSIKHKSLRAAKAKINQFTKE